MILNARHFLKMCVDNYIDKYVFSVIKVMLKIKTIF